MSPPAGRLVIRAPNWLGDAVLALPAIAAIRQAFAGAEITIAGPSSVAALFREHTDACPDHVLDLPEGRRASIAALAVGKFDTGILFPNSFRTAWELRRAGVSERWGYATAGRGVLLTRKAPRPSGGGVHHHSEYFRALVRGLDMPCGDMPPRLMASAASLDRADTLLGAMGRSASGPLIGFAPGAAYGQAKQYPPDRVAAAMARLVAERGATCAIVGASHDRAAAREIESWLRAHAPAARAHVVDLVGRTSLGMLAGVATRCAVFVSNDSGAMHVAAAVGRPVVAIFGPTDERATHPIGRHDVLTEPVFCRPCHLRDCPIDHRCMKRISSDRVFDAVMHQLAAPSAG